MLSSNTISFLINWYRDNRNNFIVRLSDEYIYNNEENLRTFIIPRFLDDLKGSLEIFLNDIKHSYEGGSGIGVVMNCFSFIDCLSTYFSGEESTWVSFENFLKTFMKDYAGKKLYPLLRSKLLHNFSERGFNFLQKHPEMHLRLENNKYYINLENLIFDIENGLYAFIRELKNSDELLEKVVKSYKSNPLIKIQEIKQEHLESGPNFIVVSGSTSSSKL